MMEVKRCGHCRESGGLPLCMNVFKPIARTANGNLIFPRINWSEVKTYLMHLFYKDYCPNIIYKNGDYILAPQIINNDPKKNPTIPES